ncbi:hypothetical protein KSP35_08195 [Aquihabitans sp. G128]|uniref:hypothetical protein n=1 Tax=Aquihabitans sp. G128 TaxID=2849779 RepID=UPI001C210E33|nr:hypothetical protein [Aquihabitans sp. G128]QXC62755.1 hypothetical protein KSP35_08195 [Aquihabitans sp. G128]
MASRGSCSGRRASAAVGALALVAVAPVLRAGLGLVASSWVPQSDDAFIVSRSFDVFTTHPPLVGAHSLAGGGGPKVHSLGPLLYVLLAVPVRVGAIGVLPLVAALVSSAALAWSVVLARRRGGFGLAGATALGILLLLRALGPAAAASIWNPSIGLAPLVLLAFLTWSVLDGEVRLLPAVALVGSFTAQAHLSFVPPSALLAAAAAVAVVARLRTRPGGERRALGLAALVLVASWALPVYQELTDHPGNLTAVAGARSEQVARGGAPVAFAATSQAVWARPTFTRTGRSFSQAPTQAFEGHGSGDVVVTVAFTIVLFAVLGSAIRRRDRSVSSGAVVALLLGLGVFATAQAFPRRDLVVALYAFRWFAIAGLVAWLVVALPVARAVGPMAAAHGGGALRAVDRLRAGPLGRPVALLGLALVAVLVAAWSVPPAPTDDDGSRLARSVGDAVVAGTERGERYQFGRSGRYDLQLTSVVGERLLLAGRQPVATGGAREAMGPSHRPVGRRCAGLVLLQPASSVVPTGGRTLLLVTAPGRPAGESRVRVVLAPDPGRSC